MKKLLFVYRFNYLKEVLPHISEPGRAPTEFLYGLNAMDTARYEVSFVNAPQGRRSFLRRLLWLPDYAGTFFMRVGFPLEIFPMYAKELRAADAVFCVNDAISFAILFWKRFGLIRADVYVLLQSAHERCRGHFRLRPLAQWWVRWLLGAAAGVFTLAECAKEPITKLFCVPAELVSHHPFVVDTEFWKPGPAPQILREPLVLSIGNDFNREYDTLSEALLPNQRAVFITTKITKVRADKHIELLTGLSNEAVRDYYRSAAAVVISSRALRYESSGFSCALQAAACGAPLIISNSPPLRELFVEGEHCLFYEPQNAVQLREKIAYVVAHPNEARQMGERARAYVAQHRTPRAAAEHLAGRICDDVTAESL